MLVMGHPDQLYVVVLLVGFSPVVSSWQHSAGSLASAHLVSAAALSLCSPIWMCTWSCGGPGGSECSPRVL